MTVKLMDLAFSRTVHVPVESGAWKRGVVRVFFVNNRGERCCIDSKLLSRTSAVRLARKVIEAGGEAEVLGLVYGAVRPPDYRVHRCKRLDDAMPIEVREALGG